jgi:hypothetical protein
MRKHSAVDLITNSSSEIYSCSYHGAAIKCKEVFDNIVKAIDPTKNAEDIFEIEEYIDPRWIQTVFDIKKWNEDFSDEDIQNAQKTGTLGNCCIEHVLLRVYLKSDPKKEDILGAILNLYEAYDVDKGTLGYY